MFLKGANADGQCRRVPSYPRQNGIARDAHDERENLPPSSTRCLLAGNHREGVAGGQGMRIMP